jgi:hypothetical protein
MVPRVIALALTLAAASCIFDSAGLEPLADVATSGDASDTGMAVDHTVDQSQVDSVDLKADLVTDLEPDLKPALDQSADDTGPTKPWWDSSWKSRRKLTFLNAGGKQDLDDFPALVVLDTKRFNYGAAGQKGEDLRFVDSDHSTVLSHEIESWQAGKTSHIWVRVPRIDKLSSTDHIWLYHDNPAAPDGQQAAAVWSSAHVGVWHLDSNCNDSTSNANHATNHGAKNSDGKAAGAQAFSGAQYLELPKTSSLKLEAFTVTLWFRSSQTWDAADWPGSATLITRATAGWCSHDWTIFTGRESTESGDAGRVIAANGACTGTGWEPRLSSGTGRNDDKYHQVALVRTQAGMNRLYLDGVEADTLQDDGSSVAADRPIQIGGEQHHANGSYLIGVIDEVRMLNGARPAAWIDADHRSVNDALISYGPEEQYGQ